VVPASIDDPQRPSGGNVYDRRLSDELPGCGWAVHEHPVAGDWPDPSPADRDRFIALLDGLPDDSLVVVDGLIASAAENLVTTARRLRVVVLLHMPEATDRVEADVLNAAAGVIATSQWSRDWVMTHYGLPRDRVWTASPGVDPVAPAPGSPSGGNLLTVGPIVPAKGQDLLVTALAECADLDWSCTLVGATDLDRAFVTSLQAIATGSGIEGRLVFAGPLSSTALDDLRSQSDLMISASRREAYGMAVAEGLAAGLPVIATDVGGHREAVGQAADGTLPGMLVATDDVEGLTAGLRAFLTDPHLRANWRKAARSRSLDLPGWANTARTVAAVLKQTSANPHSAPPRF
jgi:glycosyltransferase involved in cell wall biosynthesis